MVYKSDLVACCITLVEYLVSISNVCCIQNEYTSCMDHLIGDLSVSYSINICGLFLIILFVDCQY